MEPSESQSEGGAKPVYFDPEIPDESEQQFSASLEAEAEAPAFVIDSEGAPTESTNDDSARNVVESASSPSRLSVEADLSNAGIEASAVEEPASDWRNQVSAKVSSYKSRKPRQERFPSLQLPFDNTRYLQPQPKTDAETFTAPEPQFVVEEPPRPRPPIILETTARILEFPRSAEAPVLRDELAEPMVNQPRIVEAPEFEPAPPALGGILIEAQHEPEPERRAGFDMPLQSARLSRRAVAGAIDAAVVGVAVSVFVYFVLRFDGPMHETRTMAAIVSVLIAILWPAYQYAFLVHTGTTPGLHLTKLQLRHFDGSGVARTLRRWRVLASLLSVISLGLGYAWCFLDEDQLSWHDRITRTHLAPKN